MQTAKEITLQMITELRHCSGYSWLYDERHRNGPFWSIAECRKILIENDGDMEKAKAHIDRINAPRAG